MPGDDWVRALGGHGAALSAPCGSAGYPMVPPVPLQAVIITEAMEACSVFVVLATKTYGAEGTSVLDTRKEARNTTSPHVPAPLCCGASLSALLCLMPSRPSCQLTFAMEERKDLYVVKMTAGEYDEAFARLHLRPLQHTSWRAGQPLPGQVADEIAARARACSGTGGTRERRPAGGEGVTVRVQQPGHATGGGAGTPVGSTATAGGHSVSNTSGVAAAHAPLGVV